MMENRKLRNLLDLNQVLAAAHRGTYGANIVQNTIPAFVNALRSRADILEIDVILSKDNVLYVFHTRNEPDVYGDVLDLRKLTSHEIDSKECINELRNKSGYFLDRLEKVLIHFKGDVILNVDRAWFCWQETIQMIVKHQMQDQIILKSPAREDLLQTLQDSNTNIMYMPIIYSRDEVELVRKYDVNLVGLELIFTSLDHELVDPEYLATLKSMNVMLWANAIDLGTEFNLTAGLTDSKALLGEEENNWGKLIDMGFNVLLTDWPMQLKEFTKNRKKGTK